MPSFAVVIPNYNQSRYLGTALESLRHQPVPFQLALMDGGSTDGLGEAIGPYRDLLSCWHSGPDGGQAAAIRQGLQRIQGDVVCWLNADDYYFPGALSKVGAFLDENPGVDAVYGDAVHVTPEGFFLSYFPPIQEFDLHDLTKSCFICQPACFVRRSAYENVGGLDAALRYTLDWDLWHRLARAGARFQYLPQLLAAVRYYPETKTVSGSGRRYMEIWRIERKYGRRIYPSSWLGSFLYFSKFKPVKSFPERLLLQCLEVLRNAKRAVLGTTKHGRMLGGTLYGFHRWEPLVQGAGTIRLPWYGKSGWKHLTLGVDPPEAVYRIGIDDGQAVDLRAKGGRVRLEPPPSTGPERAITVECLERKTWKFLDLSWELT